MIIRVCANPEALGAAAAMLLGLQASLLGFSAVSLCAFAGGALAVLLVMGIAGLGRGGLTTLLLCGVAVSSFLSALLSGLLSINHEALESVYMWTLGSFASASYGDAALVAAVLLVGLMGSMALARDLNAVSAGGDARMLGVDAPRVRLLALLLSTLLTATAVSVSGVIGFVGLTAPHAVRRLTGADHRSLLPLSALAGGLFLLLAEKRGWFRKRGDEFLAYALLYAVERAVVEGLRSDSLYWGGIRVSQLLSLLIALAIAAYFAIRWLHSRKKA